MTQSQFSLAWESHRENICHGLSILQQNGEFVDMTLAADGHLVKVHQLIMALASPYIKELIASAACPHPVIFLNKISYATLSSILEYIYTGEVVVSTEHLMELVEAAKELHIKGLEDMKLRDTFVIQDSQFEHNEEQQCNRESMDEESSHIIVSTPKMEIEHVLSSHGAPASPAASPEPRERDTRGVLVKSTASNTPKFIQGPVKVRQYTMSNQGSLQMILNRFIYYLKHKNKNHTRQWRCVDYLTASKCPAMLVTKDDMVVQRVAAHNHPYHDKKILKKVRNNAVFSAIQDVENEGNKKKSNQNNTL